LPSLISVPHVFLSSANADWDDMLLQVRDEPQHVEDLVAPKASGMFLVLVTSGAMRMEYHEQHSPWQVIDLCQGDFILVPDGVGPIGYRWTCQPTIPVQTLQIHLDQMLMAQIADEMELAQVQLQWVNGFQDALLHQVALALRQEIEQPFPAG